MSLSARQIKFCKEYIVDANGTQAAIRAGYSKKTANEQAARLLANVSIKNHIKELQEKADNKLNITRERILAELAKIAFSDIRKIFNKNGTLKAIQEIDTDTAVVIASIEVSEFKGVKTKSIRLSDKIKAIDSICKILGYNAAEKIQHEGAVVINMLPIGEYLQLSKNENDVDT